MTEQAKSVTLAPFKRNDHHQLADSAKGFKFTDSNDSMVVKQPTSLSQSSRRHQQDASRNSAKHECNQAIER
jgi:hypothetical protein